MHLLYITHYLLENIAEIKKVDLNKLLIKLPSYKSYSGKA